METRFKELTVDNAFDFCDVLAVIGVDQIIGAFDMKKLAKSSKNSHEVGVYVAMNVFGIVCKNLGKARNEVCEFLANTMEWENGTTVEPDYIRSMKLAGFVQLIKDFSKKEDLADFFGEVAGFINTENQAASPLKSF